MDVWNSLRQKLGECSTAVGKWSGLTWSGDGRHPNDNPPRAGRVHGLFPLNSIYSWRRLNWIFILRSTRCVLFSFLDPFPKCPDLVGKIGKPSAFWGYKNHDFWFQFSFVNQSNWNLSLLVSPNSIPLETSHEIGNQ